MVTDFDCWHPEHDHVEVSQIIAILKQNASRANDLAKHVLAPISQLSAPCPHGCHRALDNAIITAPEKQNPATITLLDAVAGRVLGNTP